MYIYVCMYVCMCMYLCVCALICNCMRELIISYSNILIQIELFAGRFTVNNGKDQKGNFKQMMCRPLVVKLMVIRALAGFYSRKEKVACG